MANQTRFAGYPSAFVFEKPDGKKKVQHLLWGDWLLQKSQTDGDFRKVRARGVDGWMRKSDIQKDRLLEVVFVDIGQGDGCLVVTPDDKHIVIDAGQESNMYRYLRWRYGGFKDPWQFEFGVISHPDSDHYAGFGRIFEDENVSFKKLYHNGIMERRESASKGLGPRKKMNGRSYLTALIRNRADLDAFLANGALWKKTPGTRQRDKLFPATLEKGITTNSFTGYDMLSIDDGFIPGYGADKDLSIQVLGPVTEKDAAGTPLLRWMSSKGKTKNGHSVVLKLRYRGVTMLLGGDLNIPSENLLLSHHTGLPSPPRSAGEAELLVEAARDIFRVDIAKACHHGSGDFSHHFLRATNPIATVISSGDNEPHSHPRADALGSIGLYGRGPRPLIFSTELARSAKDNIREPYILRKAILDISKKIENAPDETNAEKRAKERLEKNRIKLLQKIERSIAVYGAIHARTDGRQVVMAQKLERPGSGGRKWDIYKLERTANGVLHYHSKHIEH